MNQNKRLNPMLIIVGILPPVLSLSACIATAMLRINIYRTALCDMPISWLFGIFLLPISLGGFVAILTLLIKNWKQVKDHTKILFGLLFLLFWNFSFGLLFLSLWIFSSGIFPFCFFVVYDCE